MMTRLDEYGNPQRYYFEDCFKETNDAITNTYDTITQAFEKFASEITNKIDLGFKVMNNSES